MNKTIANAEATILKQQSFEPWASGAGVVECPNADRCVGNRRSDD